ncbi:hypothetical protein [Algoriphagus formosus]|uniref:hypothetical protein n=1 Tax=Algoriphagus formosus TaxID=2007308 RepID=UPI000C294456|nr:hypothetical protein [Algoriphagus formosus]
MDEDQIILLIQENEAKQKEFDEAKRVANEKNRTQINQLVDCVNSVLEENNIPESINSAHINFEPNAVGNNYCGKEDKKLTEIFFNHVFPKPQQIEFAHFTSVDTAKSIVGSKSFWVFNLAKNAEAEYQKFYEDHGLFGFREQKEFIGLKTSYEDNRKSIFSLSFTSENNNSEAMWESFGNGYKGVKLFFKVESESFAFRKIRYSKPKEKIKLLKDLSEAVKNEFGTTLRLYKISKAGAFYISGLLDFEDEYRFIHDRINDTHKFDLKKHDNGQSYVIVPFENPVIKFKLFRIEKGAYCDLREFEELKAIVRRRYEYEIEFIE